MATLGHDNLPTLENSQPISLETPKIWASAALTTPVDDDIYDCSCCDGFSALDEAASAIADLKREERGSNFYRDVLASIRERNSGEIRRHSRDASEIGNSSETWLPWPFDRVVKSSGIRIGKMTRCFAILAAVSMIMPAAAMDHELVPVGASAVTAAAAAAGAAAANVVDPNHIPTVAAGTCTGILFLCVGYLTGAARSLLGPLMGITSVLWFIMRNDAAIKPGLSWMIFGAWSIVTLTYLSLQCLRVTYHKVYMLMVTGFAGICLCVVALVQKSSIKGGIVTAIPPCASFAAYAVAFCFPDRPRRPQLPIVEHESY
ncbi:hypothetical protein BU26DRAFT_268784 [Trematosphaeria pertusa]|uniref:DUF4203 domain-containing protein n=1 Tax=Trematosphaeria pertusa TaxID=390896 RepID=A0A6A6IJZ9_9PLEO|nr:uncharacterized protein BU26DRAFT_268784 [Trematosphaeria pertusa]KAF2250696.1 hypothetical protein BU26DRAFT_268784 [Trematosphaeria pertusa]